MKLVSAGTQQINIVLLDRNRNMSKSLYRICVEQYPVFVGNRSQFPNRLYRTNLIIYMHHGYKDRVFTHRLCQCFHRDPSLRVYREIGYFKPLFLQKDQRIVHRGMFNGCGNDMISGTLICQCRPNQCHIV